MLHAEPVLSARSDPGLDYLDALRASFARATTAAGVIECRLEVGGLGLRLRFAGPALADLLLPPFEHLAGEAAGESELRIDVFDAESTGIAAPPLPWSVAEAAPGTNPVTRYESERACVLASAGTGALTAADASAGEAVFHLPGAGSVVPSECAAPLREALHILTAPRGRTMVHAGAVGQGGNGVLLVGRGGSGKSTLALSCALAGMEFVADDYLLLETGPPLVHALQSTAKLTLDSATRLGLTRSIDPAGFEPTLEGPDKALVDVRALAPDLVRRQLRVSALIAPVVANLPKPVLAALSPAHGLRAMAPSTILQMRSRKSPLLGALGGLVREVPSYELRLSPDPVANAAAVAEAVYGFG